MLQVLIGGEREERSKSIGMLQVLIGGERPTLCSDVWSLGRLCGQNIV